MEFDILIVAAGARLTRIAVHCIVNVRKLQDTTLIRVQTVYVKMYEDRKCFYMAL